MKGQKTLTVVLAALLVLFAARMVVRYLDQRQGGAGGRGEPICGLEYCVPSSRAMSIEDYVRMNISKLSPAKESLGGTFYVTAIEAHGGAGTVRYEDGHAAYVADFTYEIDADAGIAIDRFSIRK